MKLINKNGIELKTSVDASALDSELLTEDHIMIWSEYGAELRDEDNDDFKILRYDDEDYLVNVASGWAWNENGDTWEY